ncbi:23263_t:CDS:2, partial [Cetraspora pellucida]
EELLCKGILRAISSLTPISEEQCQKLEGQCLCQTHYNREIVNKTYYQIHQTKLNEYFTKLTGKAAYRSLKDILSYIISSLIQNGILQLSNPTLHIQISEDGHNKFLAICLRHKAANAEDFCLWCLIKKKQNGIMTYDWTISKHIENINLNYSKICGHKSKPLFFIISLTYWVIDELYVMLRITDWLWLLLVLEIGIKNNSKTSTSLTEVDKLKVLQNFNLDLIFLDKHHAQLIQQLWNCFNKLYEDMHKQCIDSIEFKKKALDWINLFLISSLGNSNSL